MIFVRQTSFEEILVAWGLHEGRGFLHAKRPPDDSIPAPVKLALNDLYGDQSEENAIVIIRWWRGPVITQIEAAIPYDCLLAEISSTDVPSLNVMGGRRLSEHAYEWNNKIDETGDWVRHLAKHNEQIGGPFLAIARDTKNQITLLDGLHRAAAWVAHLAENKVYPLRTSIILTRNPVYWEFRKLH
jgi:hypothetical protein